MTQRLVMALDPARGDELSAEVVVEKKPDGRVRVVSVSTWDPRSDRMVRAFYDLIVRGWKCAVCGGFNGEEVQVHHACQLCGRHRPT